MPASQSEIQQAIDNNAVIIDVRTTGEYSSSAHPRSINIPLSDIETSDKLPQDKNKPIIVHCASGMRSENAKGILQEKGYTSVINAGGLAAILKFN
jgi:rhodanese-related sulfurtransferase